MYSLEKVTDIATSKEAAINMLFAFVTNTEWDTNDVPNFDPLADAAEAGYSSCA